jgi:hypothetical protein
MPRSRAQTRSAGLSEASAYLSKAREFLRAAEDSLQLGSNAAAVGNAVHAGILAADAIAAVRSRAVWRGEHAHAASYLEAAGEDGKQAARHLRRLLPPPFEPRIRRGLWALPSELWQSPLKS